MAMTEEPAEPVRDAPGRRGLTPRRPGWLGVGWLQDWWQHERTKAHRTLPLAALTGALVGPGVAMFEWLARSRMWEQILEAPLWVIALAPLVGLVATAAALRWLGPDATPSSADEYIRSFHDRGNPMPLKPAPAKLLGGLLTLGTGGAMGFEGPSLYLGASIGTLLQRRFSRWLSRQDAKVLLVAGAAAGVAAIFKAPATGAVFALEVPYRDDTARRMLLPALLGAATGYLSFVAIMGTEPLFAVGGVPPLELPELGGALALGVLCGIGARGFALAIRYAKTLAGKGTPLVRALLGGGALALLFAASHLLYGEGLALGAGYDVATWLTEPGHTLGLIAALFLIRLAATCATLAGGGVGGLFIPLVIAGAIVGRAVGLVVDDQQATLFTVVGIAAFLGAGYRTPLAGVMFVAESTGRPGFVVPGLLASVVSQLFMGPASVSAYQRTGRVGHLERRVGLPLTTAIQADVLTVPPDVTLDEFHRDHLLLARRRFVAVVDDDGRYVGMAGLHDLQQVPIEQWGEVTVADIVEKDLPTAPPDGTVGTAVAAMEAADVDVLPIVDGSGGFVGVVTSAELLRLDEILGEPDQPR